MKKLIILLFSIILLSSCGGSNNVKPIEATYADTPGPDSSLILPKFIDTIPAPENPPLLPDSMQ